MEIKQTNPTIKSRAAVAFSPNQPLQIVEIDVEMPRKGEVLIRNTHTGVCHTDAFTLSGSDPEGVFPVVLGHEGAGVVVAVGEGVSSVKPGDHVIPLYTAECGECEFCRSGKTNLCVSVRDTQGKGLMPDGTTRFSYQGQPIYHYMGCSTFSEYSVVGTRTERQPDSRDFNGRCRYKRSNFPKILHQQTQLFFPYCPPCNRCSNLSIAR